MNSARPPETSAHERLYRNLRQRIMLGELPPGLPMTLRGIAAEHRVSMTPAREAVRLWHGQSLQPVLTSFSVEALTAAVRAAPELRRGLLSPRL
ncbi:MAG TPA: GntR family transcriptional regulator, partial [Paracoccus sp. (in: a-proteobacteria)]|nr:GntR family transcriptional regulator [Paracoccus sp. (in: a-proteobacteria)]